jgi:hypothetical protein
MSFSYPIRASRNGRASAPSGASRPGAFRLPRVSLRFRLIVMAVCEVCGNEYGLSFQIHTASGGVHTFDSFECAIHRLAPECEHCRCRIIGHGVQVDGRFFCCANCARSSGVEQADQIRDAVTRGKS